MQNKLNRSTNKENTTIYPNKIVLFGTGVFVRGFIAYFIDQANKKGHFQGSIVGVESTGVEKSAQFNLQEGLFTHHIKAYSQGQAIEETYVNGAIANVIPAQTHWGQVLELARNPEINIIVSNTTEVGLQYQNDDIFAEPPAGFPAKLTRFLWERYQLTQGDSGSGFVILPSELVNDNGDLLREVVLKHAGIHRLSQEFLDWIVQANTFCNTLVDRIVPGTPRPDQMAAFESALGYKDPLMVVSELYRLWAIEGSEDLQAKLSFANADSNIIIAADIEPYRERKLRILNGTHTFACGAAYLYGATLVKDAMSDPVLSAFIARIMLEEVVPSLPDHIPQGKEFAYDVLDRFRNPFLEHQWLDITVQYTTKMNARNIPSMFRYYQKYGKVPQAMCLGFACFLYFSRPKEEKEGKWFGVHQNNTYLIRDDKAAYWRDLNAQYSPASAQDWIEVLLADKKLWTLDEASSKAIPLFSAHISHYLKLIEMEGVRSTLQKFMA